MASGGFRLAGGFSSATDMGTPYAHSRTRRLWAAAAIVGACYGAFLIVTALRVPRGAELTGQFTLQPAVKALTAALLAGAALTHAVARERRWLIPALLFSAAGDFLLAMPWWEPSFVFGLAAFLVAHLCFLARTDPADLAFGTAARGRRGHGAGLCRAAGVVLAQADRRRHGRAGDALHRSARRDGVCGAAGPAAHAVDRAGRGVLRGVRRDDRHRQVRPGANKHRGVGATDLVGVRGVTCAHHGGLLLRPRVRALCYTFGVTVPNCPARPGATRQQAEHEPIAR